jgi:hypothetical protein
MPVPPSGGGILKMGLEVGDASHGLRMLRRPENEVYGPPWKKMMETLGEVAENVAALEAPVGETGQTVARLYHKVQDKPVPLWVRVGTSARRSSRKYPRGYPYPKRINYDPRSPHRGWLERAGERAKRLIDPLLDRTAREIEARWGRGG